MYERQFSFIRVDPITTTPPPSQVKNATQSNETKREDTHRMRNKRVTVNESQTYGG